MADIIQLLPDHVANQIAAGEVIQRPSSVVKELMENAVDAKASNIKLVVKDAGKTRIQVIDNGIGMSTTDARLSFERHATSKIRAAEDLFQINTRGFRGEALASIAAVAHVEMNTKREDDELGTQIKIEGSKVIAQDVAVMTKGTSVAVKNLFFNIPARRNFLKSDKIELRHIINEFHRVALAHPALHFNMYHNGSELFNLPATNLKQRIVNIFGPKTNEKLIPVHEDTQILKINGFVCKPKYARKSRGEQFFFVNNRFIKNPYLHYAIVAAFEGLIKEQTHPGYFLFLDVDPATIDINIHPTKTEIKFEDEHTLYSILKSAVKHSLGQFSITPVLDFEKDANLDIPYHYKDKEIEAPIIEINADFNPFKEEIQTRKSGTSSSNFNVSQPKNWESLYTGLPSISDDTSDFSTIELESEDVTAALFDKGEEEQKSSYQLHGKYVITTIKSGMVIIHQSRA
ncbi:MAG: DNA mismatch repair endonuclease MutL, partial [Bacteroidota bacterium]